GAGEPEADRADGRVRRVGVAVRAAAEHLRRRLELAVELDADDRLVALEGGARRGAADHGREFRTADPGTAGGAGAVGRVVRVAAPVTRMPHQLDGERARSSAVRGPSRTQTGILTRHPNCEPDARLDSDLDRPCVAAHELVRRHARSYQI